MEWCIVLDEQKAGVDKEACDLRASLREVEKVRLEGRRDLHDFKRQLKIVEAERNKLSQELGELQVRVAGHEERAELARRENHELKQKVIDHTAKSLFYISVTVIIVVIIITITIHY